MTNITKNEVVKAHVVCATKDIEANTFIAEDKVDDYFEIKDVEKAILEKKIYDKVFGINHNISSTTMLHYPTECTAFNEKAPTISQVEEIENVEIANEIRKIISKQKFANSPLVDTLVDDGYSFEQIFRFF